MRSSPINSLELGTAFDDIAQVAKMLKIANSGAVPGQIRECARASDELNIMRQTTDSLPSGESGIARYADYCDLVGGALLPPDID